MPESAHHDFDFETWASLADRDPEGFEARRHHAIEEVIQGAPAHLQTRLRRLQWKLDQVRRTSATPMAACIRMNRLMWERITGPGGLLEVLVEGNQTPAQREPASVLRFRPARGQARA
ncbi:MAG: DUF3135 domain-containing protein [Gammaproteobacteria bacterium]